MDTLQQCAFCFEKAIYKSREKDFSYNVSCPNCGEYIVSSATIAKGFENKKHLISGYIREKNDLGLALEPITRENISSIIDDPILPRTILQHMDKVSLYIYKNTKLYGEIVVIDEKIPYSVSYARNQDEFFNMIDMLVELQLMEHSGVFSDMRCVFLTYNGLCRAEELSLTNIHSNNVFVAMGFKPDLLKAYEESITPACKECGYNAMLIIEKEHNDDITDKIIAEIKTSKFVITDFTYNNQGAYFEAGFAQGRGLPVIRTCKKEWFDGTDQDGNKNHLHFDINHYNFILWKNHDDLKEKLINRIRATIL